MFNMGISFTGRIDLMVEAENEEEAIDKVWEKLGMKFVNADTGESLEEIGIELVETEWGLIQEESRGNIKESFINDMEIWEE